MPTKKKSRRDPIDVCAECDHTREEHNVRWVKGKHLSCGHRFVSGVCPCGVFQRARQTTRFITLLPETSGEPVMKVDFNQYVNLSPKARQLIHDQHPQLFVKEKRR